MLINKSHCVLTSALSMLYILSQFCKVKKLIKTFLLFSLKILFKIYGLLLLSAMTKVNFCAVWSEINECITSTSIGHSKFEKILSMHDLLLYVILVYSFTVADKLN